MQAYECTAEIDAAGALHLPDDITAQMISRKQVRVLVLLDEHIQHRSDEEQAWNTVTATTFLRGYSDNDAIYDML
jgi:hypothetical protein